MLSKIALPIVILTTSLPANASTWVRVSESSSNAVTYVDTDSISRAGNHVTFWEKVDASNDRTVKWRQAKERWSDDCAANTSTLLSWATYDAAGNVLESRQLSGYAQEVKDIIPDSVGDTIHSFVCKFGSGE